MRKSVKIISLCCVAIIIIAGICYAASPKTLDFRGTVTEIEITDGATVFHISTESIETSYIVIADRKTSVSHCHNDDPEIDVADIIVGDTIEGNYRWLSNGKEAKFITVWCRN